MSRQYSQYELVSPEWMNKKFFELVLREYNNDNSINVVSLNITPAAVNNDHYGSLMYRVRIEANNAKHCKSSISLVVKTMPETESKKTEMLKDSFIFKNEIRMYSEAIPKMEAVLRKYGDDTILGARMVYSAMEPHQVIIFEDLAEKGFSTLKNRMATEEEIKRAMLKIAKWHAVSFKLAQEEPESMTTYNDGMFNMDMQRIDFFVNGIKNFIKKVLMSDDELKQYIPYFEKLDQNLVERCVNLCNAYKRGDKAILVLNHGDFHSKNMMFKHKANGELDDLMLVDFQLSYYGPAVADVIYAIFMLWDKDTRWKQRDEMIHHYFTNFVESLKKIEFKGEIPRLTDFRIDLINYGFFEVFLLSTFLPFVAAFADETVELDKVVESEEHRMKLYLNPVLLDEVKRTLPKYLHEGLLD